MSDRPEIIQALESLYEGGTVITLENNNIDDEGAKALATALSQHDSLTELRLADNNIGEEGAEALATALGQHHSLTVLDLNNNNIGNEGVEALATALGQHHSLTELRMDNNDIGEEGAKALATALGQHHSLRALTLNNNNIGEEGAEALATALGQHHSLTVLDLSNNNIGNEGVEALATALGQHHSLTVLYLYNNDIGEEGAKALATALSQHQPLTKLALNNNNIGEEGAEALATALGQHHSLTELYLSNNNIGNEGVEALATALGQHHSLTVLGLDDNNIGNEGVEALATALGQHHSLTVLYLYNNDIGEEGAKALATALSQHHSLTELYLNNNNIGNEGVKALAIALGQHHSLTILALDENNIGDEGVKELAKALCQHRSLIQLTLASNDIGDEGGKALATALKNGWSLTILALGLNRIGSEGVKMLADALDENQVLQQIQLDSNIPKDVHNRIGHRLRYHKDFMARQEFSTSAMNALSKDKKVQWGKAKLMVLGKAGAGKTSTIRTLLSQAFVSEHESTIGVDLKLIRTKDWKEERIGYQASDLCEDLAKQQLLGGRMSIPRRPKKSLATLLAPRRSDKPTLEIKPDEVATPYRANMKLKLEERGRLQVEEDISFTVWDYGGQEVFYALHHLFLTKYGVYVIVFDMRELIGKHQFQDSPDYESMGDTNEALNTIQFWLESVRLHAKEKVDVVLVGTYLDALRDPKEDLKLVDNELREHMSHQKDLNLLRNSEEKLWFFPLDNTERENKTRCKRLQTFLMRAAASKSYVKEKVSLRWSLCLKRMFSNKDVEYMELDAVNKIATESCGISKKDVPRMLEFMHDLGVLVHLKSTKILEKYVVLKPQWLLNNLSRVICDPRHMEAHANILEDTITELSVSTDWFSGLKTWETRSVVSQSFLRIVWGEDFLEYFSTLMVAMLLACRSPWVGDLDEEGALLVPSLLKAIPGPDLNALLLEFDNAALVYITFEHFPRGVFQRFLASMVSKLPEGLVQVKEKTIYSNAASIIMDGICVLLLAHEHERRITFRFLEDDEDTAEDATPIRGTIQSCVELLHKQLQFLDEAFMHQNLKPALFLSCDGTTNDQCCVSIKAFANARNGRCLSEGRERLKVASFSAIFPNQGEARAFRSRLASPHKKKFDVFLSHAWGKDRSVHQLVCKVASILKEKYKRSCWLDRNEIRRGDIMRAMTQGIDDSTLGIVFISREYMDKVNSNPIEVPQDFCRMEFRYMMHRMTLARMIPVVLEKEMKEIKNWSGVFLGLWEGTPLNDFMMNGGRVSEIKRLNTKIQERLDDIKNAQI